MRAIPSEGSLKGTGSTKQPDPPACSEGPPGPVVDMSTTRPAAQTCAVSAPHQDNYREGNGRTQRILTEHVAEHAGYVLDWHRIEPAQQNAIMAAAFEGELGPLHDALTRVTLPIFRGGAVDESPWPTVPTGPERAPNFWRLSKPGHQVLEESRAAAAGPNDMSPTPVQPLEQQHERGR